MGTIRFTFKALVRWPGAATPAASRRPSKFRATWASTRPLLERELRHLGAREVMLEADADPKYITTYGELAASARLNGPGIVLRFVDFDGDRQMYACDAWTDWQDNLRAIALTLEALRAVSRYGAVRGGEQYRGFKQLPAAAGAGMTPEAAAALLAPYHPYARIITPEHLLLDAVVARDAIRGAVAKTHPDAGGERADYDAVEVARRVLEEHHRERGGSET